MRKMVKKLAVISLAILLSAGLTSNPADAAKKAKMSKSKLSLMVGQSKTLSVKNLSKKQKKKVKWSSSKKKIATVSKKGKVTAKKAGKTTITAKVGKKKYTCKVTVTKKTTSNSQTKPPAKTKEQLAAEDRANLKKLVEAQRAAGANVPTDLDSRSYFAWNEDGRLISLDLSDDEGSDLGFSGEIDVTPFTALETLKVAYNTKVTKVITKGVTALKILEIDETAVSSIDVSTNVNLESLYISGSKITSLDVSKNRKLACLCCDNTNITKLNLSKNTALQRLICFNCKLTSLDLSKNTSLIYLSCKNNKLVSLDVSNLGKSSTVEIRCDEDVKIIGANKHIKVNENDY